MRHLCLPLFIQENISSDNTTNRRIFVVNYTRNATENYTILEWEGETSKLSVTVDWEQEGE